MLKSAILPLAACAGLIAGCASQSPARLSPRATAASLQARTLDDPGLSVFLAGMHAGSGGRGWDLDRLTLAAVYFHPDLQVANAKLESAEAAVKTAREVPNPFLGLSVERTVGPQVSDTFVPTSPWTAGAAVNFLVETFGKRGARIEQARDLRAAARSDVQTAAWGLRDSVRSALIELWAARRRAALERQTLDDQTRLVGLLQQRLGAGAASSLDLARERTAQDKARLAVLTADGRASAAQASLAAAIGAPVKALAPVSIDFAPLARGAASRLPGDLAQLEQRALTSRPDVQAQLARYAAADAGLRLALAGRIPNVTLGPSYTFDQGEHRYGLAASAIELPIFNQHQGPVAQAVAGRKEAAAEFLALQARVLAGVEAADTGLAAADRQLAGADRLESDQSGRQAGAAAQFRAGQIDHPALLVGALELDAARVAQADAAAARLRALGAMEDALEQPLLSSGLGFQHAEPPPLPETAP